MERPVVHFQLTAGTSVRNAAVVRDMRHRGEHVLTLLAVRAGLVEP